MKRPCETIEVIQKDNGCFRSVKHFSYVALLTKINDDEVMAVRYDGYTSKLNGLFAKVKDDYPDYNVKGIWKLYDSDFEEEK